MKVTQLALGVADRGRLGILENPPATHSLLGGLRPGLNLQSRSEDGNAASAQSFRLPVPSGLALRFLDHAARYCAGVKPHSSGLCLMASLASERR